MNKYKIYRTSHGYAVWMLKELFHGLCWDDTGRRFRTKKEAEKYIQNLSKTGGIVEDGKSK